MADISRTLFSDVYEAFLSRITDDMYMEFTVEETNAMMKELLLGAIPKFEFPRVCLDYDASFAVEGVEVGAFVSKLSQEEINILAAYMVVEWVGQQLTSVENTRMKYSGSDFKIGSQANHLQKIALLKKECEREGFHLQRLYKRRVQDANGVFHSSLGSIMDPPKSFQIKGGQYDKNKI